MTPLKTANVTTTTNIENKVCANATLYYDCKPQLFANMHLSVCKFLYSSLVNHDTDPSTIKRVIAYGSI